MNKRENEHLEQIKELVEEIERIIEIVFTCDEAQNDTYACMRKSIFKLICDNKIPKQKER